MNLVPDQRFPVSSINCEISSITKQFCLLYTISAVCNVEVSIYKKLITKSMFLQSINWGILCTTLPRSKIRILVYKNAEKYMKEKGLITHCVSITCQPQ